MKKVAMRAKRYCHGIFTHSVNFILYSKIKNVTLTKH